MKNKKFILLILSILLLAGCSNDKCIKSHKEDSTCIMYQTLPNPNGGIQIFPIFYPCEKEVCDLYESEIENEEA